MYGGGIQKAFPCGIALEGLHIRESSDQLKRGKNKPLHIGKADAGLAE